MSRKHYEAIAAAIRLARSVTPGGVRNTTCDDVANMIAHAIDSIEPKFNRERFIAACEAK